MAAEEAEEGEGKGEAWSLPLIPDNADHSGLLMVNCIGDELNLSHFQQMLGEDEVLVAKYHIQLHPGRKCIHINSRDGSTRSESYIFSTGALVCWEFQDLNRLIYRVCSFLGPSAKTNSWDNYQFFYGDKNEADPDTDHPIVERNNPQAKWAISFAMAQSAKLDYLEKSTMSVSQTVKGIINGIINQSRIVLNRRIALQRMGIVMKLLIQTNLDESDFLSDVPDQFWDEAQLAKAWRLYHNYLDIKSRASVLTAQLKVLSNFYSMLNSELHSQKANKLEWCIIALISIEVVFSFGDHAHWFKFFV